MDFEESRIQRRRSERVVKSLPIVVRGVDLLGQEFEERTATLSVNLHGCRYASRYHLPKNTWITLEVARGSEFRNARARVAWIQRPHSVREFFQINAELETPQNIWLFEQTPENWDAVEDLADSREPASSQPDPRNAEFDAEFANGLSDSGENVMNEMNSMPPISEPPSMPPLTAEIPETTEHPLLQEFRAELERRAAQHAGDDAAAGQSAPAAGERGERPSWMPEDAFRQWKEGFEREQLAARERLTDYQGELLGGIRSEFEASLAEAKRLIEEIEKNREELHAENKAAAATAVRLAQERLEMAAIRQSSPPSAPPKDEFSSIEDAAAQWRERFQSEMTVAQTQWNELLQSSLDRGVHRIVAEVAKNSQEIARDAEFKLTSEVSEVREPLLQNLAEARETLGAIRSAVDEGLARAKASLAEIERSVAQMKGVSSQIDATTQNAVEDLNRRLTLILDAQTREMGERAEAVTAASIEKISSALANIQQQVLERAAGEVQSKVAPHLDRLPEILRELSTKELQMEESLRLQRERFRQISEISERELLGHLSAAVAESRKEFDALRQETTSKLNEDIDSRVALASTAAAGAMERVAGEFEQDARGRLEALIEQGLAAGTMRLAENVEDAKGKFENELHARSSARIAQIHTEIDGITGELAGHARTQIEQAAEVTAAAFGEVLRGISDQEAEQVTARTATALREHTEQLETSGAKLLRQFETNGESFLARFHQQMESQLETAVAEGRGALSNEFNSSLAAYRQERENHEKQWAESLDRMSGEAATRCQDRIATAGDSCVVSSIRRLNEHGQNVLDSLMRSADQALRESCAKLFDGFAEILRERSTRSESMSRSSANQEAAEAVPPPGDPAADQPSL